MKSLTLPGPDLSQEFSQEFTFDADRAIFWKNRQALLLSDVHLGKAETFQKVGIPISSAINGLELLRMDLLIEKYRAKELWILGDLIHARQGMTTEVEEGLATWLGKLGEKDIRAHLIRGNHDKKEIIEKIKKMQITVYEDDVVIDGILLSHEGGIKDQNFCIYGHVHPVVRLSAGNDSLRLPCFARGKNFLILPAFSQVAGGFVVDHRKLKIYPIIDQTVSEL